jgi:hypothetical protein
MIGPPVLSRAEKVGKALAYLVAQLACIAGVVVLQILVFVFGWGLTPRSWWWILGVGVGGGVVLKVLGDAITKAQAAEKRAGTL